MSRPPRQKLIQAVHEASGKAIATFIASRAKLTNSQIEEILSMGTEIDSKRAGTKKAGTSWARLLRGGRPLEPTNLARAAHKAVEYGWLTPDDLIDVHLVPGGARMLNSVQDLLLAIEAGRAPTAADIDAHYRQWCETYDVVSKSITAEKNALLKSADKASDRLMHAKRELAELQQLIYDARHHAAYVKPTSEAAWPSSDDPEEGFDVLFRDFDSLMERMAEMGENISDLRLDELPLFGLNDLPAVESTPASDQATSMLMAEWFSRNAAVLQPACHNGATEPAHQQSVAVGSNQKKNPIKSKPRE